MFDYDQLSVGGIYYGNTKDLLGSVATPGEQSDQGSDEALVVSIEVVALL